MLGFHGFSSSEHAGYRFGFNGQENDSEIKTNGNHVDFGARGYDPRLGRWWSLDPYEVLYPGGSNYDFALSNPIRYIDFEGNYVVDPNASPDEAKRIRSLMGAARTNLKESAFLMEKFKEHSGLTDSQIDWIFEDNNQGPVISMSSTLRTTDGKSENYAKIVPGSSSSKYFLDQNPKAPSWDLLLNESLFMGDDYVGGGLPWFKFFATMAILHEVVHLGDAYDGIEGNEVDYSKWPEWKQDKLKEKNQGYYSTATLNSYNNGGFEPGKAFEFDVIGQEISSSTVESSYIGFRAHERRDTREKKKERKKKQKEEKKKNNPKGKDYTISPDFKP